MPRLLLSFAIASLLASCVDPSVEDGPDTTAAAWEAPSPTDEHMSTHLWIVNRAIDQLRGRGATTALATLLDSPACRTAWQLGVYDADYKAPYHGGWSDLTPASGTFAIALAGANWASHFYDPSTGTNYKGQAQPTARTEALLYAARARTAMVSGDRSGGCYQLGLALHYFTDLTQPMHAANFTAAERPLKLHSNVEQYSVSLHDTPTMAATAAAIGTPTAELEATAWRANQQWTTTYAAIEASYRQRCRPIGLYLSDTQTCWRGDPRVDGTLRNSLAFAPMATARFLRALGLPTQTQPLTLRSTMPDTLR